MTILILGGEGAMAEAGWATLFAERMVSSRFAPVVNLSDRSTGALSALPLYAEARLALHLDRADLLIWDHAESLRRWIAEEGIALERALRPVELLLRACVRARQPIIALLSEGREAAASVEPDPVRAALTHLFERYAAPTVSLTAELRARLRVATLDPSHFAPSGRGYAISGPATEAIVDIVEAAAESALRPPRPPFMPTAVVSPQTIGAVRVALPAHALGGEAATSAAIRAGDLEIPAFEIAPGGFVEFEIEGEFLGLLVAVGPHEGALTFATRADDGPKALVGRSASLRAARSGLGEIALEPALEPAMGPAMLKPGSVLRLSNPADPAALAPDLRPTGIAGMRLDDAAAAPGPVRIAALVERRPNATISEAAATAAAAEMTDPVG
ncbi:MAG: hypothetical protein AAFW46_12800 [Pseudomonadota bacterium]